VTYKCAECGEAHDDLPDLHFEWPGPYFGIPPNELDKRVKATEDLCVIDKEHFFVRGLLMLPMHDRDQAFGLGVWVSLKKENFEQYIDNYESADIGPFFGWFSNALPFYSDDTFGLKTSVHFQGDGLRPLIRLDSCEHPIYTDFDKGITRHEAWEMLNWPTDTDE